MKSLKWFGLAAGAMSVFQLGGCGLNDLLVRFAGAGAVVSGLTNLLGGA